MNRENAIRRRNAARTALERAREVTATCEAALQQARIDEEHARERLTDAEVAITDVLSTEDKAERKRRERGRKKADRLLEQRDREVRRERGE